MYMLIFIRFETCLSAHRCLDMLQCGCCQRWRRVDEQTLKQFSNEAWSIDQLHQERLAFDQQFPGFEGDLRRWLDTLRSSTAQERVLSLQEFLRFVTAMLQMFSASLMIVYNMCIYVD